MLACTCCGAEDPLATTSYNVLIYITGEFVLATKHCRRSVEAVEVVYGEDSIELAQELHKLAQLLFNR